MLEEISPDRYMMTPTSHGWRNVGTPSPEMDSIRARNEINLSSCLPDTEAKVGIFHEKEKTTVKSANGNKKIPLDHHTGGRSG